MANWERCKSQSGGDTNKRENLCVSYQLVALIEIKDDPEPLKSP